jgi:phosphoglycolate phosphatase-like HAD superfamily hydrolase
MKYIIFDFDGTIGDSQSLIVKTLQDTMRARKLEVKSEEACAKTIGLRLDEAFVSLFGMSAEEGMECAATYREIFLANKKTMIVQPFPHVIETLRALHRCGLVLGMASSRNHCSLDGYVHQMQLERAVFLLGPDAASHGGCLRRQSDRADQGHDRGVHGAFCHG